MLISTSAFVSAFVFANCFCMSGWLMTMVMIMMAMLPFIMHVLVVILSRSTNMRACEYNGINTPLESQVAIDIHRSMFLARHCNLADKQFGFLVE